MEYPKISVVTVNYNLAEHLEETILSVIQQGYPNLEYIIIDGGSTDGSVEIIKKYEEYLTYWVSEPDEGQYYAVQKGFDRCTGDIMGWINSDDRYHPGAFMALAEIFTQFPEVRWLTGFPTEYTESGITINRITLPWARWSKYRHYTYDFQFVQQESTFWRRDLWEEAGSCMNLHYKLAGDMELWCRFFRYAKLHTTLALIGGFRYRKHNQRSRDHIEAYLKECARAVDEEFHQRTPPGPKWKYTLLRIIGFPLGVLFFLNIPLFRNLYEWLYDIPYPIIYNFDRHKFEYGTKLVQHPPIYLFGQQWSLSRLFGIRQNY